MTTVPVDAPKSGLQGTSCLRPLLVPVVLLVAACSSTPVKQPVEPVVARPPGAFSTPPPAPSRKGGGYYLDDGPGDNPPANLELLPDAVPRVEKYASGANRPYNVFGTDYVPDLSGKPYKQRGVGSWYGRKFHGQRTSSGEVYDMYAMTAAHPTLPIPCYALVTNVRNGRSVIVRVNDRGPFLHNRVMDLSYAAAYKVGYLSSGSGMIEVEMLMPSDIAAGRIPVTTTGVLLAAAQSPATAAGTMTTTAVPPVTTAGAGTPPLTMEQLIARLPVDPQGLPPAPAIVPDAASRSLPLTTPSNADASDAPALLPSPDRQPAATLPEIGTSAGFYLQLGAFRARSAADSFAAHVGREIDPALASRIGVVEGNGLYRVRVGPYARRADADGAAGSLRAAVAAPVLVLPTEARVERAIVRLNSLIPVIVSGVLGLAGIALALWKRRDDDSLARATRRPTALQLLSDEEFSLMLVLDECIGIRGLIAVGGEKLGRDREHLDGEALRIVAEAQQLLADVRARRRRIEPQIEEMDVAAIEAVIATAYHGKKLAEAQLQRTRASRADTVQAYGFDAFTRAAPR